MSITTVHAAQAAARTPPGAFAGTPVLWQPFLADRPDRAPATSAAGRPVPAPLARTAEHAFGMDFSQVRIVPDAALPVRLGALAVTRGDRIELSPALDDGTRHPAVLAHELAHVAQQRTGRVPVTGSRHGVAVSTDAALEREADQWARSALRPAASPRPPLPDTARRSSAGHASATPVAQCLALDLDPKGVVTHGWARYEAARRHPRPDRLQALADHRAAIRDWLERLPDTVAPGDAELGRAHLDLFRRYFRSAEALWQSIDRLLDTHHHPDAGVDTHVQWATRSGQPFAGEHAHHAPTAARYHVDLFGEGHYAGAINITATRRSTTTDVPGTRIPNLIHRRFSARGTNHLPIADHTADVVTAENGPIELPGLLEEIARIAAPGGTLVLLNPDTIKYETLHAQMRALVAGARRAHRRKTASGTELLESVITVPRRR